MIPFFPWIVLLANALVITSAFPAETLMKEKSSIILRSLSSLFATLDSSVISSNNERAVYPSLLPNAMKSLVSPPFFPHLSPLSSLLFSVISRYLLLSKSLS